VSDLIGLSASSNRLSPSELVSSIAVLSTNPLKRQPCRCDCASLVDNGYAELGVDVFALVAALVGVILFVVVTFVVLTWAARH
jgi:hypothetical protein